MMLNQERAGLLAWIGAGLIVVALAMLTWTGAVVEGPAVLGYLAAIVTGTAGGTCLVIAGWWAWRAYVNPPRGGDDQGKAD